MFEQLCAVTGRNLKIYLRDKGAVFFSLLSMLIVIGLMIFFLGSMNIEGITDILGQFPNRDAEADEKNAKLLVQAWTCAGIISINAVTVTLAVLSGMIKDKVNGKLNSIYTAPVSRIVIAAGYVLAAWISSVFICMLTLAVTELYGVVCGMEMFSLAAHIQLMGMIVVNSFTYASFMYVVAALAKSEGAWSGLGTVLGTLVGFLGGIYLPIGSLSESIGNIMKCTPVIYGTAMFRSVMTKDIMSAAFHDVPDEIITAYRKMMGIDLYVFDKSVTVGMDIGLLFIFGAVFLMIGAAIVKHEKKSDR